MPYKEFKDKQYNKDVLDYTYDFSYSYLEQCRFTNVLIDGTNMYYSRFYKCVFYNCIFKNVDVSDSTFEECIFFDVNNDVHTTTFIGCNLTKSDFIQCSLKYAGFYYSNLDFVYLYKSNLHKAIINTSCSYWDVRYNDSTVPERIERQLELYNTNI